MTSTEIARTLRGRRLGKGKWMAKCPSHRERTGSLSITDMGQGRTRLHCFGGCNQGDVLQAAGLTWKDLRPGGAVPLEIRRAWSIRENAEEQMHYLQFEAGYYLFMAISQFNKRQYWLAAERRVRNEMAKIECILDPEKVIQEWRERMFQQRVKKYGWEQLWKEIP